MMIDHKLYNDEFLNAKRLSGDPSVDKFIQDVFAELVKKLQLQQVLGGTFEGDLLDVLKAQYPDVGFISKASDLPLWADLKLMKVGSAFFAKHAEIIMSLLGLLSLPYCYTAANGAMVLHLSERIRKQTTKRLYDTAVFVWEVMAPDAFGPTGNAYKEILKVRLLHSAVRYYTLQSGKWDHAWGLPINQEDPGEILREEIINAHNLTILKASQLLKVTRPTLSNILNGKSAMTPNMAIRISKVFGGNADLWIRLQSSYELRQAEK